MAASNSLTLCTFNCRSAKSSINEIASLCQSCDVVFLQEHWLLHNELDILSNIHPDFLSLGHSSVDASQGLLLGRPFGGTCILYNKALSNLVVFVETSNPRISALMLKSKLGPVLLVSVYMPTDYGNNDCFEDYVELCSELSALFSECDAVQMIIAGDFNCQPGSRFFPVLQNFIDEHNMILSDIKRLSDVFTFYNVESHYYSWIDHIACSSSIDSLIERCEVRYEYITSDHKPVLFKLNDLLSSSIQACGSHQIFANKTVADWSMVDELCLSKYQYELSAALGKIAIPSWCFCNDIDGRYVLVQEAIDNYYSAIISCVKSAINKCIPTKVISDKEYIVPGWNEYVDSKHAVARSAFLDWVYDGKPRYGPTFEIMRKSRAQFKLAFRYCRKNEETLRADGYAKSVLKNDYKVFWNDISKNKNACASKYASVIDGCVGDDNIVEHWRDFYAKLYNSSDNDHAKQVFMNRMNSIIESSVSKDFTVHVQHVVDACGKLKKNKSPGPDGISSEAFCFACPDLFIHLAMLFNLFLKFNFLPKAFMQSVIIPVVKNKAGNLSDMHNYRAIAISNIISKIFESLLTEALYSASEYDNFQFGFKADHSTGLCTNVLKETVNYYRSNGSHVFACFIDFSKAFDNVNYWKLFTKLLDDNVNCNVVRILAFWYSNQNCYVRWRNSFSTSFSVGNGTRQGSVLSPYLFARYIRELIGSVVESGIGCCIGNQIVNILAYADDIVLISPSWRAMQHMLTILHTEAKIIDMTCNVNKTVAMMFQPKKRHMSLGNVFPEFTINSACIKFVSQFKYLGHILTNNLNDDEDINREIRNTFVRTNILKRKFGKCSRIVKTLLFKGYCICFYDIALWKTYNSYTINKFRSCYNRCAKIFFGFKRQDSLSAMQVLCHIPTFDTILHNARLAFRSSKITCANALVKILQ